MVIRTDLNQLNSLSVKLKRLENDLSQITSQLARTTRMTVQSVKLRSTDYQIRKTCERIAVLTDSVNKTSRNVCDRIYTQSRLLSAATSSYKEYDRIDKVNTGALSNAGPNLSRFFGYAGLYQYSTLISTSSTGKLK